MQPLCAVAYTLLSILILPNDLKLKIPPFRESTDSQKKSAGVPGNTKAGNSIENAELGRQLLQFGAG